MAELNSEQAGQGSATPQVQASTPTNSQPGEATENAQAQQPKQEPQYVTVEELSRREEEIIRRIKQSDKDRNKRIEGEIASLRNTLSKANVQLAPDQEAKLREEIGNQIDGSSDESDLNFQQAIPLNESVTETGFIQGLFKETEAGVDVTPNDPEFADFDKVYRDNYNDPSVAASIKVIRAAEKAAAAKAQRLKTNTDAAQARVMQGGGQTAIPNDISGITDSAELYAIGDRKIRSGK